LEETTPMSSFTRVEPASNPSKLRRPEALTVTRDDHQLVIERKWNQQHSVLAPFLIGIWNLMLITCSVIIIGDGIGTVLLFFSIFYVAGILGTWYVAAHRLNSTTLTNDDQSLRVQHHPVPWGGLTLRRDDIKEIYIEHWHSEPEVITETNKDKIDSYTVKAVRNNGREFRLTRRIYDQAEALYVEHQITSFLQNLYETAQGSYKEH